VRVAIGVSDAGNAVAVRVTVDVGVALGALVQTKVGVKLAVGLSLSVGVAVGRVGVDVILGVFVAVELGDGVKLAVSVGKTTRVGNSLTVGWLWQATREMSSPNINKIDRNLTISHFLVSS
jgi:hypothetical protein